MRSAFAYVFPLLLGFIYLLAGDAIYQNHLTRREELQNTRLLQKVELLAARIKSEYTSRQQIEKSMQSLVERLSAAALQPSFSPEKELVAMLAQSSEALPLSACQIWAFTGQGSNYVLAVGKGLMASKKRAMEKAFSALLSLSGYQSDPGSRKSSEKFINGLFGENSAPEYLATQRQGILTPVHYEGSPHYLYWQGFSSQNACFGGLIALVSYEFVENTQASLARLVNQPGNQADHEFRISFVGSHLVDHFFKPVMASRYLINTPDNRNFVGSCRRAFAGAKIPMRKLHLQGDWWHYIDIISQDTHFYVTISGKNSMVTQPRQQLLLPGLSVYAFIWSALFFLRLRHSRFNLGQAFKMLFFMTGMLPVLAFMYLAINLIQQSHAEAIKKRVNDAFFSLEQIDEQTEETIALAGLNIKELLAIPDLHRGFAANDYQKRAQAFNDLKTRLRQRSFYLNYLLNIRPGHEPESHVSAQKYLPTARYHLDYYTISAATLHSILTAEEPGVPQISLNNTQRSLASTFGSSQNQSAKDIFLSSLDRINSFQAGSDARHVFFSSIHANNGLISNYLVLGLSVTDTTLDQINWQMAVLNADFDCKFFCINRDYSSGLKIYPTGTQYMRSGDGKRFREFFESASSSIFKLELHNPEDIFIYEPLSKTRKYYAAAVISLKAMNGWRDLKYIIMLIMTTLLAGTIYLLASAVSSLMIQPATRLNRVFGEIASGDYNAEFSYPFNNELGQLARATTQMTRGLKERRLLGKFVSTTFDTRVKLSHQQASALEIAGTVMFSDIRSFTTISESHPPEEIARLLNTHMREMSEIINRLSGRVEQFIGDAIVAFFPGEIGISGKNALQAAAMMMKKHAMLQHARQQSGQTTYAIGIGLDFGIVMAGILHAKARSEFTVIGPARSNAEQCETSSKRGLTTRIMTTAAIACQIQGFQQFFSQHDENLFELTSLDKLP